MRRAVVWLVLVALFAAGFLYSRDYVRRYPQNVPWTDLDLDHPVGWFTLRKLAALGGDADRCRALLRDAGIGDAAAPLKSAGPDCGYADGMLLSSRGRTTAFRPSGLITSCPVAAALALYEREVLQIAALRHFGSQVAAIDHAGSYNCRRRYGRNEGPFSEHATADALDIIGFRLADGTRISVLADWRPPGRKQAFLREVRDGACELFPTVLSPDYNAAHADHLHLDQAERGKSGFGLCR